MTQVSRDTLLRVGRLLTDPADEDREGESILQEILGAAKNPANVLGHYVLLAEVGRGGTGTVYRAYDRTLQRTVAVKVIGISRLGSEQVQALRNEFVAMARLRHPNIISVFDSGVVGDRLYCVMEWMEGRSLHDAVSQRPLSARRSVEMVRDIAGALEAAHRQGFLHMDVKPANILLAGDVPKLGDFSAARRLFPQGDGASDTVRGTPGYMAPEQLAGQSAALDQRTDVFGLGMTMHALLTGSLISLPSSPSIRDRGLRRVVEKATQRDPARRYSSAAEMKTELTAWLERRPLRPWIIAAAAFLALAVGFALWRYRPGARADRLEKKAQAFIAEGKWEEAWEACRKARALDPDRESLRSMEASIALELEEYEIASSYYGERLRRDPTDVELNRAFLRAGIGMKLAKGRFHFGDGNRIARILEGESIPSCVKTLAQRKDPAGLFLAKWYGQDKESWKPFLEREPTPPYEFAILRLLEEWRWGESQDLAWMELRWPRRRGLRLLSAMFCLKNNEAERASNAVQDLDDPDARRLGAVALLLRGDRDEAIRILDELGSDLPETRADLAICWYEKGNRPLAEKLFKDCLDRSKSNDFLYTVAGYYLLHLYVQSDRLSEAVDLAESLLDRSRDTAAPLPDGPVQRIELCVRLSDTFWNAPQDFIEADDILPFLRKHPDYETKVGRRLKPRERKPVAGQRTDKAELLYTPEVAACAQNPTFGADSRTLLFLLFEQGMGRIPASIRLLCPGRPGESKLQNEPNHTNLRPGLSWNIPTGRIAFASDCEGCKEILTAAWDGSREFRVTNHAGPESYLEPSFSPSGRSIVFAVVDGEKGSLWKIGADGKGLLRLTSGSDDRKPAWSPLDDRIVFQRRTNDNWDLYTIRPDGADLTPLTDSPSNDRDPAWSPDGKWIVFSSDEGGIFIVSIDEKERRQATTSPYDGSPCWSPDGKWIAFESRLVENGGTSIWKIAAPDASADGVADPDTIRIDNPGKGPSLSLNQIKFWTYQIENLHLGRSWQRLADSHYDLVVIDQLRSMAAMKDFDDKPWVAKLKSSANREGGKKLVLASLGAAQADSSRCYWQSEWHAGSPPFLLAASPNWAQGFSVRFWDPAWREIVFKCVDRIVADGFDGICVHLGGHDSAPVLAAAGYDKKDVKKEAARFLKEISARAKAKKRGFLILAAGAESLEEHDDYVNAIDGHVQEEVWFRRDWQRGVGDTVTPPEDTQILIEELDRVKKAGKAVFTIDFAAAPDNVSKAYREAQDRGYVPFVTAFEVDGLTATPPPGY